MVEVLVLGTVGTRGADGVEPIRSEKQRVLAGRLALADGAPISERALFDELWETLPADPAHALHAHVSRLRQVTGLVIEHTGRGYRIDSDLVAVDAMKFEALLRTAKSHQHDREAVIATLREAIALWRGPVLEDAPDTPSLHEHRARLELLYEEAVTKLVDAHLDVGDPDSALPLLREAIDRNPVDERRWAQLMTALDRIGRRDEALEAYAQARDQLVTHLGLEPGHRLQQIQRELLDGGVSAGEPGPPGRGTPLDLVGRDREWSILTKVARDAHRRQQVAVITGEPGIGKTHVASRFLSTLMATPVHSSRCQPSRSAPYGALAGLIRSDCAGLPPQQITHRLGTGIAALRNMVPDVVDEVGLHSPVISSPEPQVEHHRIRLAFIEWLRCATASGPLCLFVDDLQWADADSLRLVEELWSRPLDLPVLWIVTLRDREHPPGSAAADMVDRAVHPSDTVTHVGLAGLGRASIGQLMRTTLTAGTDHEISPKVLDDTLRSTGGNPLFVLESARQMQQNSSLDLPESDVLPSTLAKIVEDHLARLKPTDRELLDVTAVIGEEFDPLLVGMATNQDPKTLDSFLAIARHLRLLEPIRADRLDHRFRHALVQAAVLDQIPAIQRAQLHLRVARAVERHPHVDNRSHVLAHHYARAVSLVGPDEAIVHLLTAAKTSMRQQAPIEAFNLYEHAQRLLTVDSPVSQRCEIHLGLGEAGYQAGTDYRADLLTAARLADDSDDIERLVRAAVANNRGWYSSIDDVDRDRVAVIEAALARLPDGVDQRHQPDRSRLLSLWAMENVRDPSRRAEVLLRSDESIRLAEDLGDPDLLGEIMSHRYSVLYATLADPVGTFEFAQRLDQFAHARIDPDLQLKSTTALAQSAMMLGDYATADQALARCEQLAIELEHPPRSWLVGTWLATRMAMRGDLVAAHAKAIEVFELGTAFGEADAFSFFAGQLFVLHHMAGRLPDIIDAVEEQVATSTDQIPAWRAAYALALTTVRRHAEAREIVDHFRSSAFESLPVDVLYLHGLSYLAETITELEYVEAAEEVYALLLPYESMIASNATIDAGPIDLRLGGLSALMGDTAAAHRHLEAAASFCRSYDATSWLSHVTTAQSRLL